MLDRRACRQGAEGGIRGALRQIQLVKYVLLKRRTGADDDRAKRLLSVCGQSSPVRIELRLEFCQSRCVCPPPITKRCGPVGFHFLPKPVSKQHRALRMAVRCGNQRVQRITDASIGLTEAFNDVRRDVCVGETVQRGR